MTYDPARPILLADVMLGSADRWGAIILRELIDLGFSPQVRLIAQLWAPDIDDDPPLWASNMLMTRISELRHRLRPGWQIIGRTKQGGGYLLVRSVQRDEDQDG